MFFFALCRFQILVIAHYCLRFENVTGQKTSIIPKKLNALVLVSVDSIHYTSSVVRKLRNFKGVHSVFEITGDYDISVYVKVDTVAELNNIIEEFRTVPGIKTTSTRMVLKKFEGNHNGHTNRRNIF